MVRGLGAFDTRTRSLNAFGPRSRSLNAFDPRSRSLNGLACACRNKNMARLGRLRGFGDDFTPAENYFLDTGTDLTAPVSTSTYDPLSSTLTPPYTGVVDVAGAPLLTPQQIASQQIYGTSNPTASQNNALMAAQSAGYNLSNLTAAQIANIRKATVGGGSLVTGLNNNLLFGGVAAILLLSVMKK